MLPCAVGLRIHAPTATSYHLYEEEAVPTTAHDRRGGLRCTVAGPGDMYSRSEFVLPTREEQGLRADSLDSTRLKFPEVGRNTETIPNTGRSPCLWGGYPLSTYMSEPLPISLPLASFEPLSRLQLPSSGTHLSISHMQLRVHP